ncbi:hypothetical protein F5Y15DRAFT_384912 [Xylariaceae sp. FL0016]|nr:hypothetical protein F5Y15DRAFT_384912 [Xylariaceae sp. FL0016]
MDSPLKILNKARRPDEPGLDLVVVHGITTLGLTQQQSNWSSSLLKLSPDNTAILSYDAQLIVHERFQWADVVSKASVLVTYLHYWINESSKPRIIVLASLGLAGYIVKHALYRFSEENQYRECTPKIKGLLFFGTPHFTHSLEEDAQIFNGILRYDSERYSRWPSAFTKEDLSSLTYSTWRFEELKLNCEMLCCYEQVPMKTRGGLVSRTVTMVDERICSAKSNNTSLFPMDIRLSKLFDVTDCVIHRHISHFLTRTLKESEEVCDDSTAAHTKGTKGAVENDPPLTPPVDHHTKVPSKPATPVSPISSKPYTVQTSTSPQPSISSPISLHGSAGVSSATKSSEMSSFQSVDSSNAMTRLSGPDQSFVVVPQETKQLTTVPNEVEWIQVGACRQANPDYRGRHDLISRIENSLLRLTEAQLRSISKPNAYVLCGAAGLGKTQTALHFFHASKHEFDVRLWIQGDSQESLFVAFKEISARLGLERRADTTDAVLSREVVKGWLMEPYQDFNRKEGKLMRWLLVIDNADNPDHVLDFWPYDGQGSIIITSRNRGAMTQNYFGDCGEELTVLSAEDAIMLLQRLLERNRRPQEKHPILQQAVEKLRCWPLAIAQMAGIMHRERISVARFLEIYETREHRYRYHSTRFGNMHGGYKMTLATAWALEGMSLGAAQLLSVISMLAPASIPEEVLTKTPDRSGLPDYPLDIGAYCQERERILSLSIVSQPSGDSSQDLGELSIHPLIQEVVRGQLLKNGNQMVSTFNAAIGLLTGVWPFETLPFYGFHDFDGIQRREQCDKLLPHATQLARFYETLSDELKRRCTSVDLLSIFSEIAWYQYQRSNMDASLAYIRLTLELLDDQPDGYPQIRAGQLGTWSNIAMETNQPDLALQKNLEALRIRQGLLEETGEVNSQIAASYTETARSMMMHGMFDRAKTLIEESISLRKQMPQFSRLQLYSPLYYKSLIYFHEGEYDQAILAAEEALREREVNFGTDDRQNKRTGLLLTCLGNIFNQQGFREKSFAFHQRALIQLRATGGDDDLDTANAYYKITSHYLRHETFGLAKSAIERAIQGLGKSRFHRGELARAMFMRSRVHFSCGEPQEASESLIKSVELRRQLIQTDMRAPDALEEADFDELVVIWRR